MITSDNGYNKAQTAIEYLLILGAVCVVLVIVALQISSITSKSTTDIEMGTEVLDSANQNLNKSDYINYLDSFCENKEEGFSFINFNGGYIDSICFSNTLDPATNYYPLFAHSNKGVFFVSKDLGDTWEITSSSDCMFSAEKNSYPFFYDTNEVYEYKIDSNILFSAPSGTSTESDLFNPITISLNYNNSWIKDFNNSFFPLINFISYPDNTGILFAVSKFGVWKSINYGVSWNFVNNFSALEINKLGYSEDTIFVDVNIPFIDNSFVSKIFYSTDYGKSFKLLKDNSNNHIVWNQIRTQRLEFLNNKLNSFTNISFHPNDYLTLEEDDRLIFLATEKYGIISLFDCT